MFMEINENDTHMFYKIGYIIKQTYNTDKIALCRDIRLSEDAYKSFLTGVTDSGCDVYDFGYTTVPMCNYIACNKSFKKIVMITVSSVNLDEVKFVFLDNKGLQATDDELNSLFEKFDENKFAVSETKGSVYSESVNSEYREFMIKKIKYNNNLKICINSINSSVNNFVGDIFTKKIMHIPSSENTSDPFSEENVKLCCNSVKENKADLGIIFGINGDEIRVIDNKGKLVSPDLITELLAYYMLDGQTREKIIFDSRSSKSCAFYVREMGAAAIIWKVGSNNFKTRMRDENALLGGELSGRYYFRDFSYSNSGILAAVYIMNAVSDLKDDNIRLSDIIQEFTIFSHSGEINLQVDNPQISYEKVYDHFIKENYMKFYDFDGLRFEFDNWWFSLRRADTSLKLVVEADTKDIMKKQIKEIRKIIEVV